MNGLIALAAAIAVVTGIGAGIGIEHLVESQHLQGSYHFSCYRSTYRHQEFFAYGNSYGRGRLHDNMLCRIVDSFPYTVDVVLLVERTYRAYIDALSAVDTWSVAERHAER